MDEDKVELYVVEDEDTRIHELAQRRDLNFMEESEFERKLDERGVHPDCTRFEELVAV